MPSVKAFFKYIDSQEKMRLKSSTCLFTISVGQQSHEGDRFSATIDLINNSFSSAIMLVDDSLQRHNMALNRKESADYFYETSIKEGDLWLKRNEKYYTKCKNLKKIIRWDYWRKHPNYQASHQNIKAALDQDAFYKEEMDYSINEFLNKYAKRLTNDIHYNLERAKKLCFDFILEECTAVTLWPELKAQYEAYPGLHNKAIEGTRKRFVANNQLLNPVTIGFRNAGQMLPQKFILLSSG